MTVLPWRLPRELCTPDQDQVYTRREIQERTRELRAAMPRWPWARVGDPLYAARAPDPRLQALASRWTPERGSMLILGPTGVGKTSTLVALVVRLIREAVQAADPEHILTGARWTSGLELVEARRETRLGAEDVVLGRARRARLLVLDELGQELGDPRWLLELIDDRYRRSAPTLTTSGLTRAELEGRYGSGAVRRLVEPVGQVIDLHGGGGGT